MKRLFAFLLALCFLVLSTLPITAASPRQSVLTVQGALDTYLGKDTPGAAVVLIEGGERVMLEGFGYYDLKDRLLVTPDTVFEIGELSSLLVALSALTLDEAGRFDLDADITTFLPASFVKKLDLTYSRTARQLLSGYSGFGGRVLDLRFDNSSHRPRDLEEALLADIPEQSEGLLSCYHPSEYAVSLVAYAIEHITGSYADYTRDTLLLPLGMNETVLNPSLTVITAELAKGYSLKTEGTFAVKAGGGRSYAGLYPASGALSSAADLCLLLEFVLNGKNGAVLSDAARAELFATTASGGLFPVSALTLEAAQSAFGTDTSTLSFGASLWLDPAAGNGAVVLTNTAESGLLTLPRTLVGAKTPTITGNLPTGSLPDIRKFKGTYVSADMETRTFVGRYLTANQNLKVSVDKTDGTLLIGSLKYVQIAPGVFKSTDPESGSVVRFLMNEEGKVVSITGTEKESYVKIPFYLQYGFVTVMLGLLFVLAIWFVLSGAFSLLRYYTIREDRDGKISLWFVVARVLSGVLAILTVWQILLGISAGAAALSSSYRALAILALIALILATVAYLLAFVFSFLRRKLHRRVAATAILYVVFLLLIQFFCII